MMTDTSVKFSRAWAMPNGETFQIAPIAALVHRWIAGLAVVVDPFARNGKLGTHTNDLSPKTTAQHHMLAEDYAMKLLADGVMADAVLLDPPYSPRQIKDCYQSIGMPVRQCDTQHAGMIARSKDGFSKIVRPGGIAICCGWNSAGFGKGRGFALRELLTVNHGGSHNDTIVTVEEKLPTLFCAESA